MRKIIADNVARSRQTAPHVTLVMEVDMTEASALFRKLVPEIQRAYDTKLTYTDLLIKAAAKALDGHPLCNAALIGDEVRVYAERNIGVAVATQGGLVVPVVRHADRKTLGEISVELKAVVDRCRNGRQSQQDLSGGTFTITNLGAYGVDSFDPIIVPPQSCILGVCRIAPKAVVVNDQIAIRSIMNLCLSFDHRVLDGAPAAQFLRRLKEILEAPLLLFV
jgi:pyruvate dehydrogenase E2 component (dihydrolipoamide acetyltransferase)